MFNGEQQATDWMRYKADDILGAGFGEIDNEITVEFKKTVKVREYETEAFDIMAKVKMDTMADGYDRTLVYTLMQAQVELRGFASLLMRGLVPQNEYDERKRKIETDVNVVIQKYEQMTGRSADKYFRLVKENINE